LVIKEGSVLLMHGVTMKCNSLPLTCCLSNYPLYKTFWFIFSYVPIAWHATTLFTHCSMASLIVNSIFSNPDKH